MCKVSTEIKFCTCSAQSAKRLKHYWVFHRFVKGKDEYIIGMPVLPFMIDMQADFYNRTLLLERVNNPLAWDIDLKPKAKDRLQIVFTCGDPVYDVLTYGFVYRKNKWVEKEFDPFEWHWKHDEEKTGKIKSALIL